MVSDSKPSFSVQVRELIEFVLQSGDLGGERDFIGPSRALAGIRGHQRLQRARPAGYQKEVPLVHVLETSELVLRIQGRIDGLLATPEGVLVEEIKTLQGTWDREADPLHWAQVKFYGYMYGHDHAVETLTLQLTYLNLTGDEVTEYRDRISWADLSDFFTRTTARYLEWMHRHCRRCQERDRSIQGLNFPFPRYRPGQRELAVATYRTLARGGRLFLEAPTGIGKTMAVLFPALKAMAAGKLQRLYYLTARTMGRTVAEKAFADLRTSGLSLRALTLTAREKICVQEGRPCDRRSCPFALGYYDRRAAALEDALGRETLTRADLEAVARQHRVCPFELSLDLSVWVDALVCDYNYVFDPRVYLRRHFAGAAGHYAFLVDEAHNLADRAREMFSADLDTQELRQVSRTIKEAVPRCAKALGKLGSAIRKLGGQSEPSPEPIGKEGPDCELNLFSHPKEVVPGTEPGPPDIAVAPSHRRLRTGRTVYQPGNGETSSVRIMTELPAPLAPLLQEALDSAETWLTQNQSAEFRENLLALYFRLHSFLRTSTLFDERFVTIIEPGRSTRIRLFCLDPSFLIRQALERGRAAVFFSATLTPIDYYRSLLGGNSEDPWLQLPSPFPTENLTVLVHDRIRTNLKAREETVADVAQAISTLVQARRGNYLVYLPSYQYLETVRLQFQTLHPSVQVLAQRSGMTESEREAFLAAFAAEQGDPLVGFAVLGGIFGESLDLAGDRLIGVIVVGVGLPQLSLERDVICDYFQDKTGAGFDYAYTFPGLNRVLQATGRVIRSETDRGVVLLIDTRFGQERYFRLMPAWWRCVPVRNTTGIQEALSRFWNAETAVWPDPSAAL